MGQAEVIDVAGEQCDVLGTATIHGIMFGRWANGSRGTGLIWHWGSRVKCWEGDRPVWEREENL